MGRREAVVVDAPASSRLCSYGRRANSVPLLRNTNFILTIGARLMKKIHMSREQLVAEAIDLITEDVQTQAFDGEILPDLLSLIPTEKLIEFLPADEEDEEENQELIDAVIEEMKTQIADNDWTVIEGLLSFVPPENLKGFLPEDNKS
jgi:hypothetical protein